MWDAIVIGSGIGGLSAAGLLAGVDNRRVLVLEKHMAPGGLMQAFRRDGACWDVGLHYVGQMQAAWHAACLISSPAASCAGSACRTSSSASSIPASIFACPPTRNSSSTA